MCAAARHDRIHPRRHGADSSLVGALFGGQNSRRSSVVWDCAGRRGAGIAPRKCAICRRAAGSRCGYRWPKRGRTKGANVYDARHRYAIVADESPALPDGRWFAGRFARRRGAGRGYVRLCVADALGAQRGAVCANRQAQHWQRPICPRRCAD